MKKNLTQELIEIAGYEAHQYESHNTCLAVLVGSNPMLFWSSMVDAARSYVGDIYSNDDALDVVQEQMRNSINENNVVYFPGLKFVATK